MNPMTSNNISDPFKSLSLSPRFDLTRDEVERSYLTKLAGSHPDAIGDTDAESNADPASINQARAALLDPEQRAIALLEVLAGPSASECKDLPDGFLMEMMIRRQEIEEEIGSGDEQARQSWEDWAHEQRSSYTHKASELFQGLESPPQYDQLLEIRVLLNAWRYIERLIEQLEPDYDPSRADFS
jgi:HSCB C-terminal oligomerisation domain